MRVDDTPQVAAILKGGFAPSLHPYLVYCQDGITRYLAEIVRQADIFPAYVEHVAVEGGRVIGYAELRTDVAGSAVLTYIAVDRDSRGRGLAGRLLANAVRRCPRSSTVEVDVFASNSGAHRFYERLGATQLGTSTWRIRAIEPETPALAHRIVDWHASAASLDRYGFCQVTFEGLGTNTRIGLPSRHTARLYSPDDETQLTMARQLAHRLPIERCLRIDPGGARVDESWETLLVSRRLSFPAGPLLRAAS